ncbi:peptidase [Streptomyces sp. NPDC060366]|uniref:peptidase n=1 Tax=Streptomyces sp. NPDC060366 TaxID=3347105 RepID=UPI00365A5194
MRAMSKARTPRRLTAGAVVVAAVGWSLTTAHGATAAAEQAEPGAELVFEQSGPIDGLRPGDSVDVPFAVKNKGDAPATRVVLYLSGSQGLAYDKKYSNCVYEDAPAQDEGPAQVNAVCDIEQTLEPGVVYEPAEPIGLDVLDRALYERLNVNILAGVATFPDGTQHGGGADPVLRLVARTAPEAPGTVHGGELGVDITAENTADFALTGSKVKGKAGRTVDAKVTFANKGPAWARNDVYGPIGVFDVGIPKGTTVTKVPEFCEPAGAAGAAGAATYRCTTPYNYADEDSERAYVFGLRIDKVVANAKGTVAFVKGDHHWGTLPFDKNRTNNTAEIVVNASAGGATTGGTSGGTTGGTGGATGSSGGTGSTGGTGTQLGELAETGSGGTLLAGGAAAALLAAGGVVVAVRRRTS